MKKGFIGAVTLGVIFIVVIVMLLMCTCKVPTGYVAVQYSMNGGVKDEVLTQGWHIVAPSIRTSMYTVGLEQSYLTATKNGDSPYDESFSASTSEGKAIQVDLTFTYQFDVENVVGVFTKFKGQSGIDVRDSFIKPNIVSWSKEVIAKYKVTDILGAGREAVNAAMTEYLATKFAPYGITISNVSLIDVSVDENTMNAINAKITAQQEAETQAIKNQTNIDRATADASVKTTQAQAEADATLIKAQAEAEANRLLSDSLSNNVLKDKWISEWDGKLPYYMSGSDSNVMIDIGDFTSNSVG